MLSVVGITPVESLMLSLISCLWQDIGNKEAVVFIYVYLFYFGAPFDKIPAGRDTLDIPVRAHYSHLPSNKPVS